MFFDRRKSIKTTFLDRLDQYLLFYYHTHIMGMASSSFVAILSFSATFEQL